jgi:DNA topoisomerase IA
MLDEKGRITDKEVVYAQAQVLEGCRGEISSVEKKGHRAAPPLAFSLSKLQMAASKKYYITDTLVHVQKLYEAGYVSAVMSRRNSDDLRIRKGEGRRFL